MCRMGLSPVRSSSARVARGLRWNHAVTCGRVRVNSRCSTEGPDRAGPKSNTVPALSGNMSTLGRRTLFTCSGKFVGDTGVNNSRRAFSPQRGSSDEEGDEEGRPPSGLGPLTRSRSRFAKLARFERCSANPNVSHHCILSAGLVNGGPFRASVSRSEKKQHLANIEHAGGAVCFTLRLVSHAAGQENQTPANIPAVFDGAACSGNLCMYICSFFPGLLEFGAFSDRPPCAGPCFEPHKTQPLNPGILEIIDIVCPVAFP